MKKLFTIFAAALASLSLMAAVTNLNFSEPTELPSGYVYSSTNTPIIAVDGGKSSVYVTNGGGGQVVADCWKAEGGLDASKGKRWMGFTVDEDCDVVISVKSGKKTWILYKSGAEEFASFTQTANQWDEWTVTGLKSGESYIISTGNSQCYISAMTFTSSNPCEAPSTPLALDADKKSNIAVGDVITFSTTGGNGATVTYFDGTSEISNPWTATAGQHSITASQDAKDGVCGGTTEALVLTAISHEPVTAAVISGSNSAFVGDEVTLTCEAENADVFQWYKGANAIAGATSATYTFTPDAAGDYTFACEASNAYTATPVKSADFTVVATVKPAEPTVLVKWDATPANRIGVITYGPSSVAEDKVKIHKDADEVKGIKFSSSYSYADGKFVTFKPVDDGFEAGDIVSLAVCYNNSNEKNAAIALYAADGATLLFTTENGINGKSSASDPVVETYTLEDDADSLFIGRSGNTSTFVTLLQVVRPADIVPEPRLSVSPASVKLKATADATSTSATVHFSGRNLAAGTYNLSLTSVAGLSADKSQVTVASDGKLSEDVVITYSSAVDVELGQAELSLTIGELSAAVSIEYTAKVTKQYATSLNIEQFVLDNGKSADIRAALDAANIDYENIDALDSLSSKDYNNYPFLGLKLKKADATLGFWLKAGSKANLKFGYIGEAFTVYFGDGEMPVATDLANKRPSDSLVVSCEPVTEDTYVSIVCGSTKTLVIKQIMIDEDIQPVKVDSGIDPTKDSDATIKSLSINGVAITREGTTYAYEVPADVNLAEVEVVYELNSAKATGNPASGFKVAVPAAGAAANEQALIVTAESGDKMEYTISVTRAASPEEGLFDLDTTVPATKLIRNGQLLIIKNNRTFTVLGQEL